jgi:leucyl aminopeptidase
MMDATLFYQCQNTQAIPLFLLSKLQWLEGLPGLNTHEIHSFQEQQFIGDAGDLCLIYQQQKLVKVYIGMGDKNDVNAIGLVMNRLPIACFISQVPLSSLAQLTWGLVQYRFDTYKRQETPNRLLVLVEDEYTTTIALLKAVFMVRDLINTPANKMGPSELADVAQKLAQDYQADFEQWVDEQLLTTNFPAIHAVGRAATNRPRLLHITWGNPNHPVVALIGKGVCFDTGGLNIKTALGMRIMKKDMAGAAHVLGLTQWVMSQKLPICLHVFIPAVENAIGADAFRPGDILTMRNGLTVEIDNTDAEGRLVLADALVKAAEINPQLMIDFATLTGAARVAVGTEISAMFTDDEALAVALDEAAAHVDDPIWRLPLFSGYDSLLESSIADLVNDSPSRYAGAIVAALFLKRFVPPSIPWVHFDIMGWNLGNKPGKLEGGEAMAIRAVAYYLQKKYGHINNL